MNLGFWKPEIGCLANSASPAEVAKAKSNQQNPICCCGYGDILEVGGWPEGYWGHAPTLGHTSIGLNLIPSPSSQNMARQHPDRFCTLHCFDVSHGVERCLDVRPDPLERLSSYLSIHIKNVQNRVRMWSQWWFWCILFLESESTIPNRIRLGVLVSLYHK
jgi:hypothetical protein